MKYYTTRRIDSANTPIRLAWGKRGIGKTFGSKLKACICNVETGARFVYVVESLEMIKTLAQDNGAKFFDDIIDYCNENQSHKLKTLRRAVNSSVRPEMQGDEELVDFGGKRLTNAIKGGTIKINGQTAGYCVAINDFANLKRNAFTKIKYIIIDEFIPENIDIRSLRMPYKIVSLVQSIARTQNIIIYMFANSIRIDDPILVRLKLNDMKIGELRVIKDEYGAILTAEYIDHKRYDELNKKQDASVAGRFAKLMGETALDENVFKSTLPDGLNMPEQLKPSSLYCCLHGDNISVRIHVTTDYKDFYIMQDYGTNKRKRYCVDNKFISPVVQYMPEYKAIFQDFYQRKLLLFENELAFLYFCQIVGIKP